MEAKIDSIRTKINKAKVLKHLKLAYGNVRQACRNANISPSQFYKWKQVDPDFASKELDVHKGIQNFALVKAYKQLQEESLHELHKLKKRSTKRIKASAVKRHGGQLEGWL